ncbi:MAG TPA: long-chain fatty acid--CoA ligase [Verrucomicrobiae bacterium]|jgi:phenylacetate-coenzyme A ligase PaaK-like adenylate-forming protein|nr:long-chain fatty acid--CoA ligase [Verrucomicrobiae bacterium]
MDVFSELQAFIHQSFDGRTKFLEGEFNRLALNLFSTQFESVPIYRRFCEARKVRPDDVRDWSKAPALPTAAFKEFEVSSISAAERTDVFYSSGTTQENRSRHIHHAQSLAVYEASLLPWFERNFKPVPKMKMIFLTPKEAPNSSLVHMFKVVSQRFAEKESVFVGYVNAEGSWSIDVDRALSALEAPQPVAVLGTAFSFVHLLDHLDAVGARISLPPGSRVMETGGYKGRSREVPKPQLRAMISKFLGVSESNIVTEYGMSELSSQAYEHGGVFQFPPWAKARVVSPETGAEVGEGETGLLQVFDLANIWSVMAVQTEDLAVRRGAGFELLGRVAKSEPRGCSLMPE